MDRINDRAPHDLNVLNGLKTTNQTKCLLEVFYTCLGIKERTVFYTSAKSM